MLLPTHLAVAIATTVVLKHFGIENNTMSVSLILLSLVPDLDVIWTGGIKHHHETLFHMPLFWIVVSITTAFLYPWLGLGILIGSMEHMLLDTFGYSMGIRWLSPFSTREYSFTKLTAYASFTRWERGYIKSSLIHKELIVITLSALLIILALY